jgi:hypothetical protein
LGCGWYAGQSQHTGGCPRREQLIVRRVSGESDDGALQGADEGERDGPSRWAGWDRSRSAPSADEASTGRHLACSRRRDPAP